MTRTLSTATLPDRNNNPLVMPGVLDSTTSQFTPIQAPNPPVRVDAPPITLTTSGGTYTYANSSVIGGSMSAPYGMISFAGAGGYLGGGGFIKQIRVYSLGSRTQNDLIDIHLFDKAFLCPADHAAWSLATTSDNVNRVDVIRIPEWKVTVGPSLAVVSNLNIPFSCRDGTAQDSLFAAAVVATPTGAGITFSASNDLAITLVINH